MKFVLLIILNLITNAKCFLLSITEHETFSANKYNNPSLQLQLQIFNADRQLSHIEAAPDKSGLVLLDYWFGLKRCLVIIHN